MRPTLKEPVRIGDDGSASLDCGRYCLPHKGGGRYGLLAALLAFCFLALPVAAQSWPTKPVRIVVPYPPGGPADAMARLVAQQLTPIWGQPVVVENRSGAAGNIGAQAVAKSPPDGSSFLLHSSALLVNSVLFRRPGYDPIADFTPIGALASYMLIVVVHPSVPVASVAELVAMAKAKPGEITYASSGGAGAPTHLAVEMFKRIAGVDFTHVPYSGAGPATADLLGGHVMLMFNNPLSTLPYIKAGKLKALAVTGAHRLAQAPELPTMVELGYAGFEVGTWFALWGPAGLPPAIAEAANAGLLKATQAPEVQAQLAEQGLETMAMTRDAMASFQKAELARWGAIIREAGIVLD